jgi:hypothetical protein
VQSCRVQRKSKSKHCPQAGQAGRSAAYHRGTSEPSARRLHISREFMSQISLIWIDAEAILYVAFMY